MLWLLTQLLEFDFRNGPLRRKYDSVSTSIVRCNMSGTNFRSDINSQRMIRRVRVVSCRRHDVECDFESYEGERARREQINEYVVVFEREVPCSSHITHGSKYFN